MQQRAGRTRSTGGFVCFLRLPEDLSLADDHRIETRGDAKKMLHTAPGFIAVKGVQFLPDLVDSVRAKALHDALARNHLLSDGINFHPITGREKERFATAGFFAQDAIDPAVPDETLPGFHLCGMMTDAEAKEIHQSVFVCQRNVMPQSTVKAALNASTQRLAIARGAVVPRCRAIRMAA